MATPVKLHVYDVSQGMASQLAPLLLGQPLDGVWHTAIVIYGHEYFYGGDGINYCPPCGTILGPPTEVVELGETEIPQDMFHDYLFDLSTSRFSPAGYHLLDHNCNTFTNEVAEFLTGQSIPERITNLPAQILATPFGQLIRPMIDSMMSISMSSNTAVHIGPGPTPNATAASSQQPSITPSFDTSRATSTTSENPAPSKEAINAESEPTPDNEQKKDDDLDLD